MKRLIFYLKYIASLLVCIYAVCGCEELDDEVREIEDSSRISRSTVAMVLSSVNIGKEQMREVQDAVSTSSANGYDEEYLMKDLFSRPGTGVGSDALTKSGSKSYSAPLRDLITDRVITLTKSSGGAGSDGDDESDGLDGVNGLDGLGPEKWLEELENSRMQIYWPYSENWDGESSPTITFDPGDGSDVNTGWRITEHGREEILVDEEYAMEHPVWVINSNEDSGFKTLEILRKENPEFGEGGNITVGPSTKVILETPLKTLILKEVKMKEHYDPWFCGASEIQFKMGSVENFTASTEAELKLYSPSVTDFVVVVKRKEKGLSKSINTVLVSDWTDQLTSCAFMIVEDDGGTKTSWKCEAIVKYNSKSYGFSLDLPFNTRDDIIWRGELSARYIETYETEPNNFGDLEIVFEFI